jgi:hypothetical protein
VFEQEMFSAQRPTVLNVNASALIVVNAYPMLKQTHLTGLFAEAELLVK